MARLFSIRPAITLEGRKFKGIRGWSGKPTHPPLTDFPIVAYVFAAVFDVLSYLIARADETSSLAHDAFVTATFVMVAGAFTSVPTALTGFWDWWKGLERDRSSGVLGRAKHTQVWRTANWHMTVMLTVTALVATTILIRRSQWDDGVTSLSVMVLSVVIGLLVAFGAAYGGALVYDYQFNVEGLKGSTVWDETEEDQLPGKRV